MDGAITLIDPSDGSKTSVFADRAVRSVIVDSCAEGVYVFSGTSTTSPAGLSVWSVDHGSARQLTHGNRDIVQACSPDGKLAYFTRREAGADAIMRVALSDGTTSKVTKLASVGDTINISPDGKQLAFATLVVTNGKSEAKLAVLNLESDGPPRYFDTGHDLSSAMFGFTPDGTGVTFSQFSPTGDNLWVQPLDGSPSRQLTHFNSQHLREFRWSGDGRTLAVSRGGWDFDIVLLHQQ